MTTADEELARVKLWVQQSIRMWEHVLKLNTVDTSIMARLQTLRNVLAQLNRSECDK